MSAFDTPFAADSSATVQDAIVGEGGILRHTVASPFQGRETTIQVLLPSPTTTDAVYRTVYLLPVDDGKSQPWGDPMVEVLDRGLHNSCQLMFVQPTFSHTPWYADHPSDPRIRQESYLLKVVIPYIENRYPTLRSSRGRLLLGFSKSGWGAYSLLLRHSHLFSKAAAWDAPLGQQSPTKYGMCEVFPTQESFDSYCVWDLLADRAGQLATTNRFALLGYGLFRGHHQAVHYRMAKLGIQHEYQDGPKRDHSWHSGWVPDAVRFLAGRVDC
jgi:S-formylglutathione hydrolase FrmB